MKILSHVLLIFTFFCSCSSYLPVSNKGIVLPEKSNLKLISSENGVTAFSCAFELIFCEEESQNGLSWKGP